jgi:hypothetical protein
LRVTDVLTQDSAPDSADVVMRCIRVQLE